ncbi:19917_t:CDS:10, partial [Dentiscutata erythropus]
MWRGRDRQARLPYKVAKPSHDSGTRPDRRMAREWEKEHSHKQVHIHQPTFTEIGRGGTIYGGVVSNDGTIGAITDSKNGKRLGPGNDSRLESDLALESGSGPEHVKNKKRKVKKGKKSACVEKAPSIENDVESSSDADTTSDGKFVESDGTKQDSGCDSTESDGNESPCEIAKRSLISNASKSTPLPLISDEEASKSTSQSLTSVMQEYREKDSTSKFDPANSYILDLSPTSKIAKEFTPEHWSRLIADRPALINVTYHRELEPILDHLFGRQKKLSIQQARVQWESLRNIKVPEYKEDLSYGEGDWKKIIWWVEWAVGQFLNAFESERNPLMQQDCHEREWLGNYLIPIFQGALVLDSRFRVAWGEITVQSSLQRRNSDKSILEERVDRGHMVDMLCSTETYEMLCLLACGGPHKVDLTKLASDQFHLQRLLKDALDDMQMKYYYKIKKETCLYTIGIQQYKSEIRIYLMEKREVYRLHLIKTLDLPLTFSTYHILRISLSWAWNIRGLLNDLFDSLIDNVEIGSVTPQWVPNDMATQKTPEKTQKKKTVKQNVT